MPQPPARSGFQVLKEVAYVKQLALLVLLGTIAETLLDFVLKSHASSAFSESQRLMRFFAFFYTGISLATFLVQAAFSRYSLQQFGLTGTMSTMPFMVALGGLGSLIWPGLFSIGIARGTINSQKLIVSFRLRTDVRTSSSRRKESRKDDRRCRFRPTWRCVRRRSYPLCFGLGPGSFAEQSSAYIDCYGVGRCVSRADHTSQEGIRRHSRAKPSESGGRAGLTRRGRADDSRDDASNARHHRFERTRSLKKLRHLCGNQCSRKPTSDPGVKVLLDLLAEDVEVVRGALTRRLPLDSLMVAPAIRLLARDDVSEDSMKALRRIAPAIVGQLDGCAAQSG